MLFLLPRIRREPKENQEAFKKEKEKKEVVKGAGGTPLIRSLIVVLDQMKDNSNLH